jgi:hypothetical protein
MSDVNVKDSAAGLIRLGVVVCDGHHIKELRLLKAPRHQHQHQSQHQQRQRNLSVSVSFPREVLVREYSDGRVEVECYWKLRGLCPRHSCLLEKPAAVKPATLQDYV